MKICGLSDLHGNLIENLPECDVLCLCGDIIGINDQRNYSASAAWWHNRFCNWANRQKCRKIIIIPGNHDIYLEKILAEGRYKEIQTKLQILTTGKVMLLIDELYSFEGVHFYGCPWIQPVTFQMGKWAFETYDSEKYEKIPKCDVLLTHDSPLYNESLANYGTGKSNYWLYGHWHDGENDITKGWYNCSRLDNMYNFKKNYNITTIDMDNKFDNEDDIPWRESSVITDFETTETEEQDYIDGQEDYDYMEEIIA